MNITETIIIPESPRVLSKEQLLLHMPLASNTAKGIANFYDEHFVVVAGSVKIKESYLQKLINTSLSNFKIEVIKQTADKYIIRLKNGDTTLSDAELVL